jgi:DNA (cytosine-5)-methyltransferase 1
MAITSKKTLTFVDLFAGCGGFSLGLVEAGLDGLFAVEKASDAFRTFSANFLQGPPEWRFRSWPAWLAKGPVDINELMRDRRVELESLRGKVDLIAGGPPCQGFSFAGRRNVKDPRNHLFKRYVEVVRLIRPKIVVLENVLGMGVAHGKDSNGNTTEGKRPRHTFSNRLVKELKEIGYTADYQVLTASDFGVPQLRPRLFVIGVRDGLADHLDDPVGQAFRLVAEARDELLEMLGLDRQVSAADGISDLKAEMPDPLAPKGIRARQRTCVDPESPPGFSEIAYSEPATPTAYQRLMRQGMKSGESANSLRLARHRPEIRDRFKYIQKLKTPKGISLHPLIRERLGLLKHRICVINEHRPAPTLTTLPDDLLHFDEPRILTVRETARLQSFPDRFRFVGKYTTGGAKRKLECPRYTQVGNAVAPMVARAIGLGLIRFLREVAHEQSRGNQRSLTSRQLRGQLELGGGK